MNKDLEKKLLDKYPKIFVIDKGINSISKYGIGIGDGWYTLVDTLCSSIQTYIDNNRHFINSQVELRQIKEK